VKGECGERRIFDGTSEAFYGSLGWFAMENFEGELFEFQGEPSPANSLHSAHLPVSKTRHKKLPSHNNLTLLSIKFIMSFALRKFHAERKFSAVRI
jgi:hypothetical protein